jgi:aspartyl-tRNA(Asn)/glutamyl-tRNA(Gln) amidotransferase subunit B
MNDIYEAVIGLEVHIQLQTASKAFCSDSAAFGGSPNSQTGLISLAHPGTLPRPNQAQVEYAIRLGLALGCWINRRSMFDRKHYFYADLPKGFQTTQDAQPICIGGEVNFLVAGVERTIQLHHIHMEEDAGKSIHDLSSDASLIDLNRAGVPLLEMVTEPDFKSGEEVYYFINELRRLVRYLEISDGNMEEGSLRCDCNISVRLAGEDVLNPRSEIKNVNSARYARKAIEYEIERQIALMKKGEAPRQETREFLPDQGITVSLRSKEDAHDYRYFPEPDILPLVLSEETIEQIKDKLPVLPGENRSLLLQREIKEDDIEIIIESRTRAENFIKFINEHPDIPAKLAANFFINKWYPSEELGEIDNKIQSHHISKFLELIDSKKVALSVAYQKLWPALLVEPQDVYLLCQKLNLLQTNDSETIEALALAVIESHPEQKARYKKGKKGLITFFMGQLMRQSAGKANPEIARTTLEQLLENLE